VTRALAAILPEASSIVATDLNQSMLDEAARIGAPSRVRWRQADAMHLPFPDDSFDMIACQFGTMFFPDKPKAFAEARRVLRSRGRLLFSVWDRIEHNEFADTVTTSLQAIAPEDPPRFLARTPHGYFDHHTIREDLRLGGFTEPADIATVTARSRATGAAVPAVAYCQGTPLRNEIEARRPDGVGHATAIATQAIAHRFGNGPVDGKIQAHVVAIQK
jgi:SAM-dependent methyltransferase